MKTLDFEHADIDRIDVAKLRVRSQDAWSTIVLALFLAVIVVGQFALRPQHSFLTTTGDDFSAFYCAGLLAHTRTDPYRVEPLRSCESRVSGEGGRADTVVDPAPLPGYAVGFFAAIAYLPYAFAKALWFLGMIASLAGAAILLSRMTAFPSRVIFLGLCVADYESFQFGQLPPLMIVATCGAAYLLRSHRFVPAAICAAITMIEPHLGLPLCVALFVWKPQTRATFTIATLCFAAISVLTTGIGGNVAYFTRVLSAQVSAELVAVDQYSLSHLLHLAGLHDRAAVLAGSISYLVMVAFGVWLGRSLSRATGDEAYLALVPPAAAMLGGTYIHSLQFAAALPAAFVLASTCGPMRRLGWCSLVLLVVPWEYLVAGRLYALSYFVAAITAAVLAWLGFLAAAGRPNASRLGAAAALALAFVLAVGVLGHLPGGSRHPAAPASATSSVEAVSPAADASENWGAYLRANPQLSVASVRREADKIPTWLGIALILIAAYRVGGSVKARNIARSAHV